MMVILVVTAIAAVLVAGCGGGAQQPAQQPVAQPAAPTEGQEIEVTMGEFRFDMSAREVKAGKVVFEVKNTGTVEHSFIIEQLGKGTAQLKPEEEAKLEVELTPGTYTVICDVAGHKEAGMQMQVVVK